MVKYRASLHKLGAHSIIFWDSGDLKGDLYQGSWEIMNQDNLTQGRLQDRFEMSFSGA